MASQGGDSWFARLFGAEELAYEETQALFKLEREGEDEVLVAPNGRRFRPGRFEAPSLAELRATAPVPAGGELEVKNIVGDVREAHVQPEAAGAVFQAASQFNCLEFIRANSEPEDGVRIYEFDRTQGPSCALACAASSVWRNYFMPMGPDGGEPRGQRRDRQLNNLRDVQALLGDGLLEVRNGYTFAEDVEAIARRVEAMSEEERDGLRGAVRIGVQWDAEVTDQRMEYKKNSAGKWANVGTDCPPVTQVFCSALALGSSPRLRLWRPLAQLVLDAAYEATLAVAARNLHRGGSRDVYLTLLGGGNFGNGPKWIQSAVQRALELYKGSGLRVKLLHLSDRAPWMGAYRQIAASFGPESPGVGMTFSDSEDEEEGQGDGPSEGS